MSNSKTTPAWGVAGLLVAMALGAVAGTPLGHRVYDYQWSDARFCDDCHAHDYANEAFAESAHASLTTCHDCHRVPIRHYPRNLFVTIFDKPQSADDIHRPDVETVICAQCHLGNGHKEELTGPMPDAIRDRVPKIDDSPLHRVHVDAATRQPPFDEPPAGHEGDSAADGHEGDSAEAEHGGDAHESGGHGGERSAITCMDCHGAESNRAHHFGSTDANCLACHTSHDGAMRLDGVRCQHCHGAGFLAPRAAQAPERPSDGADRAEH
jgi:5-methylcytosine-specific restriction endonuclease McrA